MSQLKLTYFDFPGGRGEPARIAMSIGGIVFEDFRFGFSEFAKVSKNTPLGQVPTLEVNGKILSQGNAINRYVGRLANLYPQEAYQAFLCDEIMDAVEDFIARLMATFGLQEEALKKAREILVSGYTTKCLKFVASRLEEAGGKYFADDQLTMADLKVFVWIASLNSGKLDYIPNDLVEKIAPSLNAHYQRVALTPSVVAYSNAMT